MPDAPPATRDRCYITTPIYYVNDKPHIGHIYTTTICDAYARFMRFAGCDVFFLTGTDEHGLKVEKAASARNISPQLLADENSAEFQRVLSIFGLTNNDFIRTTQPHHERQVQSFIGRLLETGAVYLGEFEGWYDEGQEEYYTDTKAKELNYVSPISRKPLTRAKEKNYYFRLSRYQKPLEEFFAANPAFVRPEARRNEVLGRLREGLQDVPVSRTNFSWGIPLPGPAESGHVIYVWIDALFNYITALGLGEPSTSELQGARGKYWPATYHVIGKEILWFHAVIWPALLMALEITPPRCVYAHSFWISEGQKMSKSLGNFIDLETIQRYLQTYGLDAWRYYLITQGPLGASDADFAAARFHAVYEKDLVSTVGNCASRVTAMIVRYCDGDVPHRGQATATTTGNAMPYIDWSAAAKQATDKALKSAQSLDLQTAVEAALELIRHVDGYINATEPFKVAKDPSRKVELEAILYESLEAVRIASVLLWPVLPTKMEELWRALGLKDSIDPAQGGLEELARWGGLKPGTKVQKVALFPRVENSPVVAAGAQS
jgi:methionyl-tRNA synthetase